MSTPIEEGAKAVSDIPEWWADQYPPDFDDITKAVFGSIDREGLARTMAGRTSARHGAMFDMGHETTKALYLDYADAVLAWLNRSA